MTNITTGARRCETYAGMFLHQPTSSIPPIYLTMNRAYDPYSGRWLSRDPAQEIGGINLYGYVSQDPINLIDPMGLCGCGDNGLGAAVGSSMASAGQPTMPKPGGLAGGGATGPYTSPASIGARGLFPGRFGPLGPMFGTSSIGGAIGRAFPLLGLLDALLDALANGLCPPDDSGGDGLTA